MEERKENKMVLKKGESISFYKFGQYVGRIEAYFEDLTLIIVEIPYQKNVKLIRIEKCPYYMSITFTDMEVRD